MLAAGFLLETFKGVYGLLEVVHFAEAREEQGLVGFVQAPLPVPQPLLVHSFGVLQLPELNQDVALGSFGVEFFVALVDQLEEGVGGELVLGVLHFCRYERQPCYLPQCLQFLQSK